MLLLRKPRPDDAIAPLFIGPPPLTVPPSYAPAATLPGVGLGQGRGRAQDALRGADFKWELGRRAVGFLAGLAAGHPAGAAWAAAAAPPLRALLAAAEATTWRSVGHPLR